ncbi:MAG: PilT/PilU family type 4a pilus ATPase [Planctomycetes bacterium]|nr:PilT/PilU family type 4a pilus ATPase [Planctomycetota bacterium]
MAANELDTLFAKIALHNRLVPQDVLRDALTAAEKEGRGLGDVLLSRSLISSAQLEAIRRKIESIQKKKAGAGGGEEGERAVPDVPEEPGAPPPRPGAIHVDEVRRRDFHHLATAPIDEYLRTFREIGASDLHFQVGAPPFVRMHGHHVFLKHPVLGADDTERRIFELLDPFQRDVFQKHNDVDFCYVTDHGRYRANVFRQRLGVDSVFRIIPERVQTLEELHLPGTLREFTKYTQGIVLITGPAGCGKSATMAALIDIVNEDRYDHIVCVEDPIEYIFEPKNCNVNQRHVRVHTENFAIALRSAMRADPDVIMVGELRDLETISMAITAAETGHLVMGTLHTTNAIRSVDRIIDCFPPKEQDQIRAMVSESIRGVVSQQLIPRKDGMGREPALEILFATPAVSNMVREHKTYQLTSVVQTGAKKGMVFMDDSIERMLRKGIISRESAMFYSEQPERFME